MQQPVHPIPAAERAPARQPARSIPILDGMLTNAIKHHRQGRLPEAERIYRGILAIDSRHAGSLHMLGMLAHDVGRMDVAIQLIRSAIGIDPGQAGYHSNLGAIFQAQGKLVEASAAYKAALDRNPNLAEAHMNLGTVLEAQGKPDQAAARFRAALALRPDLAEAHMNLGNILQSQGQLPEAVASHDRALAYKPDFAEACFNRGNALQAQGKLDEAVASYRHALDLKPGMPEAHGNMGNALQAQQRLDEAVDCYERALAMKPDYAEAHYNMGNARQAQELLTEAADCYLRALTLKPQLPEAHYNLGNTRQAQNDLESAATCFQRALALKPNYAEAHYNLGCVLQQQGRLKEALSRYQAAVTLKPDYGQARFGQALAQIQSGDFANGWRTYEARWRSIDHDTPMRAYPQPLWAGEQLRSGRLRLWGEQGVGDEIMFAGLIPDAMRAGNPITLECDPRLQPLFARSFPTIEVVSKVGPEPPSDHADGPRQIATALNLAPAMPQMPGAPSCHPEGVRRGGRVEGPASFISLAESHASNLRAPSISRPFAEWVGPPPASPPQPAPISLDESKYSAHLPTGSLPALFRKSERAFAASTSPYLKPDRVERVRFRERYSDGRLLVGLAWQTGNRKTGRKRSIDLRALATVLAIPGIRWISLQYGGFDALEQQAAAANAPILIDPSVDQFASIDLFAAQVAAMDHVLTIDNSTAHLAGALGLPVSLMLPFAADWRWLKDREDSPWYPTMRLFRQSAPGNWDAVVDRVQSALQSKFSSR
jgi:tetratricopeptide (TPR) repeat protein